MHETSSLCLTCPALTFTVKGHVSPSLRPVYFMAKWFWAQFGNSSMQKLDQHRQDQISLNTFLFHYISLNTFFVVLSLSLLSFKVQEGCDLMCDANLWHVVSFQQIAWIKNVKLKFEWTARHLRGYLCSHVISFYQYFEKSLQQAETATITVINLVWKAEKGPLGR